MSKIAVFLANLECAVRSMTTEQMMSLTSAVVAVGGLAVAILARLQAAKAYKLAKAAEERATYRSVVDRLARQIYIKARRDLEWNQTLHKLHPNEYEDPANRANVTIKEDLDADFDEVIALVYERYPDIDKVEPCGGIMTVDGRHGKPETLDFEVIFKKIDIQEK